MNLTTGSTANDLLLKVKIAKFGRTLKSYTMKKLLIAMLAIFTLSFTVCPTVAYADWSHGTAKFKGNKPKKSKSTGNVIFYYNGTLKKVGSQGNADVWEPIFIDVVKSYLRF